MPITFAFHDLPSCTACRLGCAVALEPPRARELLDNLPWAFLNEKKGHPWTMARPSEEEAGIYLAAWYSSNKTKPCLLKCLDGSLCQILLVKMGRLKRDDQPEVEAWLRQVRSTIQLGVNASMVALLTQRADVDRLLEIALAFWMEAAIAYDAMDDRQCVSSLLQAYLYLGVVSGPALASERSKEAANAGAEPFNELTLEAIDLLGRFPDNHFKHVAHARSAIIADLASFQKLMAETSLRLNPDKKPRIVRNIDSFLSKRCEPTSLFPHAAELKAAFERVSVATTGRPERQHKPEVKKRKTP
jgi:hypothetical protein